MSAGEALAGLERIFSVPAAKAEKILASSRAVLRKAVPRAEAERYRRKLAEAGLEAAVDPVASAEPPQAPAPATPAAKPAAPRAREAEPPPPAAPQEPGGEPTGRIPFRFTGTGAEYFRIWLVNFLLSALTLGIYSAWAKVRRKRYFYRNTRLAGAGFDYLADPVAILKGRAVVVAGFFVYSLLSQFVPLAGPVLTLAVMAAVPWLALRSLAFNARNSSLRNIRFGFRAGTWEAAKAYLLWPAAAALTLGLLAPAALQRQKRFAVANGRYGATGFAFSASTGDYYRIFLGFLLPLAAALTLTGAAVAWLPQAAFLPLLGLYLYGIAFFSVRTNNLLFNRTTLGPHRFEADMEVGPYAWILFSNTALLVLTLGLFHPWARVRAVRYKVEHLRLVARGDLDRFVAAEREQVSALGEEMGEFMDFDFGL